MNCLSTCLKKFEFTTLIWYRKITQAARFIHDSVENYPKDALYMHAEKWSYSDDLPGELYKIEADGKIPDNYHWQQLKPVRIKSK